MKDRLNALRRQLQGGFFLSVLMGVTDGSYCAQRSQDCAMVQLGFYLAEPRASRKQRGMYDRSFLPADAGDWAEFLGRQCRQARSSSPVITCLTVAALDLECLVSAATAFLDVGGDVVELNLHGGYWRYLKQGRMRAMTLPENQSELLRWALVDVRAPLILKFHGGHLRQTLFRVLSEIQTLDVLGVHINVGDTRSKSPDPRVATRIKAAGSPLLLASGYVRSAGQATALFAAGADAAGIAEPTIADAVYIHRIAQACRVWHQSDDHPG